MHRPRHHRARGHRDAKQQDCTGHAQAAPRLRLSFGATAPLISAFAFLLSCQSERLALVPTFPSTGPKDTPISAASTHPPSPAPSPDPRDSALLERCGLGDDVLHTQAAALARQVLAGRALPDSHELSLELKMLGEPHVWPRAWSLSPIDRTAAPERLAAWLDRAPTVGERRCGITSMQDSSGREVLAVVTVDVLADLLEPIPMQVRPGAWITLDAKLLVAGTDATVVALGPRGLPRSIPTSYESSTGRIVARFSADKPGLWFGQLLATVQGGPRPVVEFLVFSGREPKADSLEGQAPFEVESKGDDSEALLTMLNAARESEGVEPVVRDGELEKLAAEHCRAMRRAGMISHDAGDATPEKRVARAGLNIVEVGENVAHARGARQAHRALWYSPSHRENMLHSRYTRVGIATERDEKGGLWVTQLFARFRQ